MRLRRVERLGRDLHFTGGDVPGKDFETCDCLWGVVRNSEVYSGAWSKEYVNRSKSGEAKVKKHDYELIFFRQTLLCFLFT